jgi:N-terminal domain of galactosyltransferase/Glycosyltransferase sugar-binding region containing DXD motif
MNVVILVPRREGFADRDRLWEYCRRWWAERHPDWPIVEGHHDEGLFNRSAALNLAAATAGDWDVAVIIDADVICDPDAVREGVRLAAETGQMVLPYTLRYDLDGPGTDEVLAGRQPVAGVREWERHTAYTYRNQVSGVVVVARRLWDACEGFDEKFHGWGGEDNAFAAACQTFGGPIIRLPGEFWELAHASAPEGRRGTPSHNANLARKARYDAVIGNPEAIRRLRHEDLTFSDAGSGIPRILHRVVPEEPDDQAELWWAQFRDLHPGWELRTWRDPIDPGPFPLTSPHWHLVSHGAQLADLVRLEVLWNQGGIYVDQDIQPFRPFDSLLPLSAFAAWEDHHRVPNAVLGAVPGHPAIRECIDLAVERLIAGEKDVATATGPGVLTAVLPWRADVLLLPPGSFYPVHYTEARLLRRFNAGTQPWAFAAHHWWGSWLPEQRRFNARRRSA